MGRLARAAVVVGVLSGVFAGILAGIATDFIVLRMRLHKNGKWNIAYVTGLGAVGALGFSAWLPLAKFVDTDVFLPSYFLIFIPTYFIMTFRVLVRFVGWVGDTI